jgi:hypothetical protein
MCDTSKRPEDKQQTAKRDIYHNAEEIDHQKGRPIIFRLGVALEKTLDFSAWCECCYHRDLYLSLCSFSSCLAATCFLSPCTEARQDHDGDDERRSANGDQLVREV